MWKYSIRKPMTECFLTTVSTPRPGCESHRNLWSSVASFHTAVNTLVSDNCSDHTTAKQNIHVSCQRPVRDFKLRRQYGGTGVAAMQQGLCSNPRWSSLTVIRSVTYWLQQFQDHKPEVCLSSRRSTHSGRRIDYKDRMEDLWTKKNSSVHWRINIGLSCLHVAIGLPTCPRNHIVWQWNTLNYYIGCSRFSPETGMILSVWG